jgi:ABC-2 type transport system permease protein
MVEIAKKPIAATDTPLSPRERALQRTGNILQWGAIFNGGFALLVGVLAVIAGVAASDLFTSLSEVLLGSYDGAADTALLIVILLGMGNLSALLVLMVGVLAQEFWAPLGMLILIVINGWLLVTQGFIPGLLPIGIGAYAGLSIMRDLSAFRINPLMLKELRGRMRGARAFVVITVYLALMSGFAVLLYLIETEAGSVANTSVTGNLGRNLFRGIFVLELLLIVFIAPAFTSGAVSSERERKTYDLLQITLLPHQSFIIGKLESALGYILLLLLAAIPLQSIAFLFGGVSQGELLLAFIILAVTAILLGTIGLFFSTLFERTLTASVRAYSVVFALTIAVPIALGFGLSIVSQVLEDPIDDSPVLQSAVIYTDAFINSLNPVMTALETQNRLFENQGAGFYTERLRDGTQIPLASPWLSFTILYLTTAAVMIVLSVRGMRQSSEE